jgi:hypothetical protein
MLFEKLIHSSLSGGAGWNIPELCVQKGNCLAMYSFVSGILLENGVNYLYLYHFHSFKLLQAHFEHSFRNSKLCKPRYAHLAYCSVCEGYSSFQAALALERSAGFYCRFFAAY